MSIAGGDIIAAVSGGVFKTADSPYSGASSVVANLAVRLTQLLADGSPGNDMPTLVNEITNIPMKATRPSIEG